MAKPTNRETKQVNLHLDAEIVATVKDYRHQHHKQIGSVTEAMNHLLRFALEHKPPPPDKPQP